MLIKTVGNDSRDRNLCIHFVIFINVYLVNVVVNLYINLTN